MADLADAQEHAGLGELLNNALVGVEHRLAGKELDIFQEAAPVVHRVVDVETIAEADLIVVLTVAGRRVHAAGARLQGDMFAEEDD